MTYLANGDFVFSAPERAVVCVLSKAGQTADSAANTSLRSSGTGPGIGFQYGESVGLLLNGTFSGTIVLERQRPGGSWETFQTFTGSQTSVDNTYLNDRAIGSTTQYRVRCTSYTSGYMTCTLYVGNHILYQVPDKTGRPILTVTNRGLEVSGGIVDSFKSTTTEEPGQVAVNQLRVASDVVSAQTVTIGADVYEVEIVNTDTTDNTASTDSFANTTDPLTLSTFTTSYTNTAIAVGGLLRIENEIVRCIASSGASRTFQRGVSGTTTASHADASDIFKGDGIAGGSTIAVGLVTTLTPTAFTPALVDDINSNGTEAITATQISVNNILLTANRVGAVATACTETLTGANNAFAAATMYGGLAAGSKKLVAQYRVPNAVEVALGTMYFAFDFVPVVVYVAVVVTATPGIALAWDGAVTIVGNKVLLDNAGSVDWAATNMVMLIVSK